MQVGSISEDQTSFDIHNLDDSDTVLHKRDDRNTLIFKDEKSRIHVLDRTVLVPELWHKELLWKHLVVEWLVQYSIRLSKIRRLANY